MGEKHPKGIPTENSLNNLTLLLLEVLFEDKGPYWCQVQVVNLEQILSSEMVELSLKSK